MDQAPGLALFDFDGTLTDREMFPDFLRTATPRARVALGTVLFAPLLLGYRLGWVSAHFLRERLVSYCLRGLDEQVYARSGERFAREALSPVLRPRALERLRWHQQRGDTVVVVSGALDVYLAHWCRAQQVDCLCSRLEVMDGRLSGRYAGAQCAGEEKARRVRAHYDLARYGEIYAYGDTHEDLALLQLARHRYYRGEPVD
ncbi:HAD family hydrolase [Tahibacter harae]|uniref:HAD-IB family hydrolase n=1 Tax=Tahibacter harae TaxID=2963937 RepID=A0ABT1QLF5_9GAMM|nr:HAD family hydrolase [Tahibacter harae]MCQ4163359.1 HAD-IB family hydrolase [Tahibacter harae]